MATITDFKSYRSMILKNAIYNRILTSILSGETSFCVASTLKPLNYQTKKELSKDVNRKKMPTYALYDILVKIKDNHFYIGIQYKTHPIIWQYFNLSPKNLRSLVEFIYKHYSINSAKSDKIFATIPNDVKLFFNDNTYSDNLWRFGLSKKISVENHDELNEKTINEYLKKLKRRNIEYRAFNKLLITLLKTNIFTEKADTGILLVQKSATSGELYLKFDSTYDWRTYEDFFPIHAFNPVQWNTINSNIDKEILVGIIN